MLRHGLGAIKNRVVKFFYKQKLNRIHSSYYSKNIEEYKNIENIIRDFRSSGGLGGDFQIYKLMSLKQLIVKENPKNILELGSGSSTVIFADYIRNNPGTHLTSLDESEHWCNNTKRLANISENESRIEIIFAPRIDNIYSNPKETKYEYIVTKPYDFVLIDGPSLAINGIRDKTTINTNIFDIIDIHPPKIILVDIRKSTVDEIQKRFGSIYSLQISDVIKNQLRPDYRYFSIFKAIS